VNRRKSIPCKLLTRLLFLSFAVGFAGNSHASKLEDMLKGITDNAQKKEAPAKEDSSASSTKDIVGTLAGSQSSDEEIKVGEGVAAQVLGAAPLWKNAKAQHYVNLVGRAVAQQSERTGLPWAFAVIDTSSINAFAAPGGIILITRGIYAMLDTEDELAAVLAHEIAHVTRQHHYKVIKQQKVVELGATLLQRDKGGNKEAVNKMINVGAELMARGLDKNAEFEADRDGMVLAARAGYDSSALISVLEKLAAHAANDAALQLLFKTHPSPADRIKELTAVVNAPLEAAAVRSASANRLKQFAK
jgi:predicted Zn-dependent protease